MPEPLTTAAIGTVLVKSLKEVGKWIWGYAKKTLLTFWENKWILIVAGVCNGLFIYYYNLLYRWFAFPPLLNYAVLGIFAIINFSWVVGYWKSVPESGGSSGSPSVGTSN
jgi:hypothetical protein